VKKRIELVFLLAIGIAPFYLNGFYNSPLAKSDRTKFWLVEILTWIAMPTALLLIGRYRRLYTWTDFGLTTKVRGARHPWILLALLFAVPCAMLRLDLSVSAWAEATLPSGWPLPPFRYTDVIPPPGPDTGTFRLLSLAHLCLTAGIVEELYYRAALNRLFPRGRLSSLAYIIISSIVFAGAHWEGGLPQLAETFAFGILAATLFRLTGNLLPLIVGHVITDWYWFAVT